MRNAVQKLEQGSSPALAAARHHELSGYADKEVMALARRGVQPRALFFDIADGGPLMSTVTTHGGGIHLGHEALECFRLVHDACVCLPLEHRACRMLPELEDDLNANIVLSCHSISYLPHRQALCFLTQLRRHVATGGKLFISALGLHSPLGEYYRDVEKPVADRFCRIQPPPPEHALKAVNLCLYSERDLFLTLFQTGWTVLRTSTSTDGNVLATAVCV
jgi:hypothetical protein